MTEKQYELSEEDNVRMNELAIKSVERLHELGSHKRLEQDADYQAGEQETRDIWKRVSLALGFKLGTQGPIEHTLESITSGKFLAEPVEKEVESEPRKRCPDTFGNSDLA